MSELPYLTEDEMLKIIYIDPGHGGTDPGAVYRGLHEKDVTLNLACRLYEKLWLSGFSVFLTRLQDVYTSLSQRVFLCNEIHFKFLDMSPKEVFISLHINADPDTDQVGMPEARGEEIFYYTPRGKRIADFLKEQVDSFFPDQPFRGLKVAPFYVLKHTIMPAVLVECGFVDHRKTTSKLKDPVVLDHIAFCLTNGLKNYFTAL